MNIFQISNKEEFRAAALETFHYQMAHCKPYRQYVELIGKSEVNSLDEIPFMPIEFFKSHSIYTESTPAEIVFTSSGTTSQETSRHEVASIELYHQSFTNGFNHFYGSPKDYSIFALLPSYMERQGSSLVMMVEQLQAMNPDRGGFYLYNHQQLALDLETALERGESVMLIGVTFALLDFAGQSTMDLSGAIVMETGGMKGRREEISRSELHNILCKAFNVTQIHSEYGMTELLSQGYSRGSGIFETPPWMQVSIRSLQDPLQNQLWGSGGINIIDLANRHSCAFIATGDNGRVAEDGKFEIFGRIVGEQLRGCNMLV